MRKLATRREVLIGGICGASTLMMGRWPLFGSTISPATKPEATCKAKSVIQIWLWGGPCHLDTFDPKPGAGSDFVGSLDHPIATNVNGIQICELLPQLAKLADKYALIRSMTHNNFGHETAAYMVQTGRMPGDGEAYPGVGAVVSLFKGQSDHYKSLIPPYIVLTDLQGRFSEAGFLGSRCKPFATGGDPAAPRFAVEGVVAQGISDQRQKDRRNLLHQLDTFSREMPHSSLESFAECENRAYDLILGDTGKIFDLSQEPADVRDRYGKNTFGQSCLMARRLVEKGVPYVTINYKGWDTHKQHFQAMRRKLPELDAGLATLISDLSQRGLLDSTIVWCSGEFGRTPRVMWEPPWDGGRGHYGAVFSSFLAGGGFKGGRVVGDSDARGEAVKNRPVHVSELIASMYEQLGIDTNALLPHPQGKQIRVMPSDLPGGDSRLREIM